MIPLSAKRRSELRAQAHRLSPIVLIGDKGLTDEVIAEIDRSLRAHELIKVRASGGDRDVRDVWLGTICERLSAYPVQQIGKVFVIYRENPEEKPGPAPSPRADERRSARAEVVTERGRQAQRARDAAKQRARDIEDMKRKGKIPAGVKTAPGPKLGAKLGPVPGLPTAGVTKPRSGARNERDADERGDEARRTSRPRSRTPSAPPESAPRRRRPRTSR